MILKIFIVTSVLMIFMALLIGLKSLLTKESNSEGKNLDGENCAGCQVKELVECSREKKNEVKYTT